MKQYVIDELRPNDYILLKEYLSANFSEATMGNLFWIPLDENLLSEIQTKHKDCQPFYFAVELQETSLACELLVRTNQRVRCDCICYANQTQRNWIVDKLDSLFAKLEIFT